MVYVCGPIRLYRVEGMPVGCYLTVSRSTHELRFRLARRHGSAVAGGMRACLALWPEGRLVVSRATCLLCQMGSWWRGFLR
ncbi:Uncharacterised protein [Bordetella pertussis]|nr:Uncharacterised protein [Bordetella pertussis]